MNITDDMVERANAAYHEAFFEAWDRDPTKANRYHDCHFPGLRAALTAALGDVGPEPLTEISVRCEECGGQWFWPLDDRQELILTTCHEHSDPPEPLEDVLLALQPGDYDPMKGEA